MLKKYYSSTRKYRKQFAICDVHTTSRDKISMPRNLSHSTLMNKSSSLTYQTTSKWFII